MWSRPAAGDADEAVVHGQRGDPVLGTHAVERGDEGGFGSGVGGDGERCRRGRTSRRRVGEEDESDGDR